jgi:hypothetical protein
MTGLIDLEAMEDAIKTGPRGCIQQVSKYELLKLLRLAFVAIQQNKILKDREIAEAAAPFAKLDKYHE